MSTYDEFQGTLRSDAFAALCGERIGVGQYRDVFVNAIDPSLVVKFEPGARSFCNIREYDLWESAPKALRRWLAPVTFIGPAGSVLLMRRTAPVATEFKWPRRVPWALCDLKKDNFGMLDGRLVCHDYGQRGNVLQGEHLGLKIAEWLD